MKTLFKCCALCSLLSFASSFHNNNLSRFVFLLLPFAVVCLFVCVCVVRFICALSFFAHWFCFIFMMIILFALFHILCEFCLLKKCTMYLRCTARSQHRKMSWLVNFSFGMFCCFVPSIPFGRLYVSTFVLHIS